MIRTLVILVLSVAAAGCDPSAAWVAIATAPQSASEPRAECAAYVDEREAQSRSETPLARVFLADRATAAEVEAVRFRLAGYGGVAGVTHVSKDEALERAKELFAESPDVMENLPGNPFPAQLEVRFDGRPDTEAFVRRFGGMRGVDDVDVTDARTPPLAAMRAECAEMMDEETP